MKIHLNSRNGVYTVKSYNNTYITVVTKRYEMQVPCSDFKCFAGGSNNHDLITAESDRFLSVVNPSMFAHQQNMINTIKEYAYKIDELDTKIAQLKNAPIHDEIDDHVEEDDFDMFDEADNKQYENWYYQKSEELNKYRDKIRISASEVYKQKLDFSDLQIHDGIKFIIQAKHDETDFRFCFDPFGFVDNFHSSISNIYREYGYGTINGGWIKVIGKNVILYYKSGDYGVYDDNIAIEAASKLFPNHKISSYAGRQWDNELTVKYDDLPF
jgi:hypothetical protein